MIIFLDALFLADSLLCTLFLLLCMTDINLLRLFCCIYQQCHTVVDYLCKSSSECNLLPSFLLRSPYGPFRSSLQSPYFMVRQDSLFTIRRRNYKLSAASFVKNPVTCDDFQTKCIHMPRSYSAASAFAFAMTSSIVPTLKNADSGYASISPSMIILNPRIVSFNGTYFPWDSCKCLCYKEWLRQKSLDFLATHNSCLIFI